MCGWIASMRLRELFDELIEKRRKLDLLAQGVGWRCWPMAIELEWPDGERAQQITLDALRRSCAHLEDALRDLVHDAAEAGRSQTSVVKWSHGP